MINKAMMSSSSSSAVAAKEEEMGSLFSFCQMLPMDGFHYYKSELMQFSDSTMAFARRGSPYTFNSEKWCQVLREVRAEAFKNSVRVPSFDHAAGDPVEHDIEIDSNVRLILAEGNYLCLGDCSGDDDESQVFWKWKSCTDCFDELWYIEIDLDEAMERVHRRHMRTGMDSETAKQRIVQNDRPNAEYIVQSALGPQRHLIDRVVQSRHDRTIF